MNYRYITLALAASIFGCFGSSALQARTLKPLTLANRSDTGVYASWGHTQAQYESFLIWLPKNAKITIPDWDVDRPTNVYVYAGIEHPVFHAQEHGSLFLILSGKDALNLKVASRGKIDEYIVQSDAWHGLKDADIYIRCFNINEKNIELLKPVAEYLKNFNYHPFSEIFILKNPPAGLGLLENIKDSAQLKQLQEHCKKMNAPAY